MDQDHRRRLLQLLDGRPGAEDFVQLAEQEIVPSYQWETRRVQWPPSKDAKRSVKKMEKRCLELIRMLMPMLFSHTAPARDPGAAPCPPALSRKEECKLPPKPGLPPEVSVVPLEEEGAYALRVAAGHQGVGDEYWRELYQVLNSLALLCQEVRRHGRSAGHPSEAADVGLIRLLYFLFRDRGWATTSALKPGGLFHEVVCVFIAAGGSKVPTNMETTLKAALAPLRGRKPRRARGPARGASTGGG